MTLADVAAEVGVSTATVSRVLNRTGPVREETRRRVMDVVQRLHYHPNLNARSLAAGKNRLIGVSVSNIQNPFFLDIVRSLETAARRADYEVMVKDTEYRSSRLVEGVRTMLGQNIAGLVLLVSEVDDSLLDQIEERRVPVVFYDVGKPSKLVTNIRVRYRLGMQRMAEYLYSLGHRRMAFIGHHTSLGPINERKRAFLKVVKSHREDAEFATALGADGPEGGRQATQQLLASEPRPTAIVCVNDYMALGVLRELRDQGLRVPGDVSVTGFDNIQLSEYVNPALTTVNIPRRDIGRMAFEALMAMQEENEQRPREMTIVPELVVRESTGPAPTGRARDY